MGHTYSHVMDTYMNLDRPAGQVCYYGKLDFTQNDPSYSYCKAIVGYTGPQLWYRGAPTPPGDVIEARVAFDACHYYTHSPWYAGMLFVSSQVLMADGTTDGGCFTVAGVAQTDPNKICPLETAADVDCLLAADTSQPLPLGALGYVCGGLFLFICCCGLCGILCLRRLRNDANTIKKGRPGQQQGGSGN